MLYVVKSFEYKCSRLNKACIINTDPIACWNVCRQTVPCIVFHAEHSHKTKAQMVRVEKTEFLSEQPNHVFSSRIDWNRVSGILTLPPICAGSAGARKQVCAPFTGLHPSSIPKRGSVYVCVYVLQHQREAFFTLKAVCNCNEFNALQLDRSQLQMRSFLCEFSCFILPSSGCVCV